MGQHANGPRRRFHVGEGIYRPRETQTRKKGKGLLLLPLPIKGVGRGRRRTWERACNNDAFPQKNFLFLPFLSHNFGASRIPAKWPSSPPPSFHSAEDFPPFPGGFFSRPPQKKASTRVYDMPSYVLSAATNPPPFPSLLVLGSCERESVSPSLQPSRPREGEKEDTHKSGGKVCVVCPFPKQKATCFLSPLLQKTGAKVRTAKELLEREKSTQTH